jgi:hypothetical protein
MGAHLNGIVVLIPMVFIKIIIIEAGILIASLTHQNEE